MSDLVLGDEHLELAANLRQFLSKHAPLGRVREMLDDGRGYDDEVWRRLCTEFEVPGLAIPEQFGGAGYGMLETVVVSREFGRALLPSRYLGTVVLAGGAIIASDDQAAREQFLPAIANGALSASLAWRDDRPQRSGQAPTTRAERAGDAWRVNGRKLFVLDADLVDVLVVSAQTNDGESLFLVDPRASGLEIRALPTVDGSRRRGNVDLDGVPARLLGSPGDGRRVLTAALDRGWTALAAEAAGGMEALVELAVDHARHREQFGRPIGSFQAVKHMCTDLYNQADATWSATVYAAAAADDGAEDASLAAAVAQAYAADAYPRVAAQTIQVHGGIGFTWEHDAHLYFRRARDSSTLLASPRDLFLTVADRVGL